MKKNITFITAIDTDSGKSIVTGLIAKYLKEKKVNVITQKIAQTGCEGIAEDILTHRKIMGIEVYCDDKEGKTCPYVFPFPASPHLAAALEEKKIDISTITEATNFLSEKYESVILEGVGGLQVPITEAYTVLDYLEEKKYPCILVSSAKLGSINHTLMSLELAYHRNIPIKGIVYNHFPKSPDAIEKDSIKLFKSYLKKYGFADTVVEIPILEEGKYPVIDFSELMK